MYTIIRRTFLVVAWLALATAASAQQLGTVAGVVRDPSGAVLPGVTVEVASPALIEKVRTAVTDGSGQYRIVNLPPGTYTVDVHADGIQHRQARRRRGVGRRHVARSNAEMKVGAVARDHHRHGRSARRRHSVGRADAHGHRRRHFKELPSGGSWIQMAALIPAVRASNMDVGGVLGDQTGAQVSAHGSRTGDGVSMIDGMRIGNMYLELEPDQHEPVAAAVRPGRRLSCPDRWRRPAPTA